MEVSRSKSIGSSLIVFVMITVLCLSNTSGVFAEAFPIISAQKPIVVVSDDFGVPKVKLDMPFVKDLYDAGHSNETTIYSPTILSARVNNTNTIDQRVLFIVEVLNSSGKTVKLDLQEYLVRPHSLFEFSPIWIPEQMDNYTIRSLAINNLGRDMFNFVDSSNQVNVRSAGGNNLTCAAGFDPTFRLGLEYWLEEDRNASKSALLDVSGSRLAIAGFANNFQYQEYDSRKRGR